MIVKICEIALFTRATTPGSSLVSNKSGENEEVLFLLALSGLRPYSARSGIRSGGCFSVHYKIPKCCGSCSHIASFILILLSILMVKRFIVTKIDNDDCVQMFRPFSFLVSSLARIRLVFPP